MKKVLAIMKKRVYNDKQSQILRFQVGRFVRNFHVGNAEITAEMTAGLTKREGMPMRG